MKTEGIKRRTSALSIAAILQYSSLSLGADAHFIRGDVNANGDRDVSDAVAILRHLFGGERLECLDAANVNRDGAIDVSDAIVLLGHLFLGERALSISLPPAQCQPPDSRGLGCEKFARCQERAVFLLWDLWTDPPEAGWLQRSKLQAIRTILDLSEKGSFAIWSFGAEGDVTRIPENARIVPATQESKEKAIDAITRLQRVVSACPEQAVLGVLEAAQEAAGRWKDIYLFTEGRGFWCPDRDRAEYIRTLIDRVAALNIQRIPIHVPLYSPRDAEWQQELCERTGGSCFEP